MSQQPGGPWQQGQRPQYPGQYPPPYGPQQPPYPGPPQHHAPRRKSWPRRHKFLSALIGFGTLVVVITAAGAAGSKHPATSGQGNAPAGASQAAARSGGTAPQTVTYVVSGDDAQVTYGPAGSDDNGTVPMRVTRPLGDPAYYQVDAQLQGGGHVACKIEVDGQVISQASADGGYNIASCEISQDPITGDWQDTNAG